MKGTLLLAIALTPLGLAAVPARANSLPLPQTSAFCQLSDGSSTSGPTQCDAGGLENVVLTLAPQVTLSATFSSAPGFDTIGSVEYAFQVVGGHPGDPVPVLVDTQLRTAAAGNSLGAAGILVSVGSTFVQQNVCTNPSQCTVASFDGTLELTMVSGQTGLIHLTVQAASGFPVAGPSSAFADPFIRVDPSFANADLYSVVVPDGVGNEPVPEPAEMLLVLVGLASLAAQSRAGARDAWSHR